MRAVNLIPADMRPGGGAGAAGRSGGAVYILLAGLVALVAMSGAYALYSHRVDDRTAKIAETQREAMVAQARATALQPYVQVQQIRSQRVALVTQLADARFNWGLAIKQLGQALPTSSHLCGLIGTVNSGAAAPGGNSCASGDSLRTSLGSVPAFDISGCSTSHLGVADAIAALRKIPGTTVVGLSESTSNASQSSSGSGAAGGCASAAAQFSAVVFFTGTPTPGSAVPKAAVVPATAGGGAAPAATSPIGTASTVTSTTGGKP
jgi:hypothetical protein